MKKPENKPLLNAACIFALCAIVFSCVVPFEKLPVQDDPGQPRPETWTPMPIKSQAEYDSGAAGGESYQIMHAMVRCYDHPERAYAIEDVAGPWRSDDGGTTWRKPRTKGLIASYGQSIAVDPVNPDKVLAVTYYPSLEALDAFAGIYLSTDGAETFARVSDYDDPDADTGSNSRIGFNWNRHRFNNQNLVYDPDSTSGGTTEAQVWYATFHGAVLLRSDDGGNSWDEAASLAGIESVYQVAPHPTDGHTIFLATSEGLYKSDDRGETISPISDLPFAAIPDGRLSYKNKVITSIAFEPGHPERMLVALNALIQNVSTDKPWLSGTGMFSSSDGGAHFTKVELTDDNYVGSFNSGRVDEFNSARYVYRHPVDPDLILSSGSAQCFYSTDGGAKWARTAPAEVFPGLSRDTNSGRRYMGNAIVAFNPADSSDILFHKSATFWRTRDRCASIRESATGFTGMAWGFGLGTTAFDRFDQNRFAFFNCDVGMKITHSGGSWFEDYGAALTSGGTATWDTAHQGMNAGAFQPIAGSQVIIAALGLYQENRLARSTDGGQTWALVDTDTDNYYFMAFNLNNPDLAFSHDKVSRDAGATWSNIAFPAGFVSPRVLGMCDNHPDTLYAPCDYYRAVLRSDDAGATWREYYRTSTSWQFHDPEGITVFSCDPNDPDLIYVLHTPTGNLVSWDGHEERIHDVMSLIPGNPEGNHVRSIAPDPKHPGTLYAGTLFPGLPCIFKSTDYGNTWTDVTGALPMVGMTSSRLNVNPNTGDLYRGGPYGTWVLGQ